MSRQGLHQFFLAGGTLPPGAASYVVRDADRQLVQALRDGEYCYVLNSRQMGKSSLCVRTLQVLRQEGQRVAFLDLTRFGSRNITPEQWYLSLASEVGAAIGLRAEMIEYWDRHSEAAPMRCFFDAVEAVALAGDDRPLCVMIDEIDITRGLPFRCDEFFAGIRECHNRRSRSPEMARLTFCLVGSVAPSELCWDPSVSPFNVGVRIELSDFKPAEAAALAAGLPDRGLSKIKRILYWTGGHPYLTQLVGGQAMANPKVSIDGVVDRLFFHRSRMDTDANLDDIEYRLLNSAPEGEDRSEFALAVLELYRKILRGWARVAFSEGDPACVSLTMSGVVRIESGALRIRNRIYRRVLDEKWVVRNLPNGEMRRRQAAVRSATFKIGSFSALIVAAFAVLAWNLHLNVTKAERLAVERSRALAEAKTTNDKLRSTAMNLQQETSLAEQRLVKLQGEEDTVRQALANMGVSGQRALAALAASKKSQQRAVVAGKAALSALAGEQRQLQNANRSRYAASMRLIQLFVEHRQYSQAVRVLSEYAKSPFRGWEWNYWHRRMNRQRFSLSVTIPFKPSPGVISITTPFGLNAIAYSPDGRLLVTGSAFGDLCVQSVGNGRTLLTRKEGDYIRSVQFSPDGSSILVVSVKNPARLLDAHSGALTGNLIEGNERVDFAEFSADGTRVVTSGLDGIARIWTAKRPRLVCAVHCGGKDTAAISVSPDGGRLFTAKEGAVPAVWDARSGARVRGLSIVDPDRVVRAAWSRNGGQIAVLSGKGLSVFAANSGNLLFFHPIEGALDGGFSPDGARFVVTKGDKMILFDALHWDRNGIKEWSADTPNSGTFAFSPDSRRLVVGSKDGAASIWDLRSLQLVDEKIGHTKEVSAVATSPDFQTLATLSSDGTCRVWNSAPEHDGERFGRHSPRTKFLAFSNAGHHLLAADGDDAVGVWDLMKGTQTTRCAASGPIIDAAYSKGDRRIVIGSRSEHPIRVFGPEGGADTVRLPLGSRALSTFGVSPDGKRLVASFEDQPLSIVDLESGRRKMVLRAPNPPNKLLDCQFSPDGSRVVALEKDGAIMTWDATSGEPATSIPFFRPTAARPHWGAAISPSGNLIARYTQYEIQVCDFRSGRCYPTFDPDLPADMKPSEQSIQSAEFSPDGHVLVAAMDNGTVVVFQVNPARQLVVLKGHDNGITRVVFSPDGKRIATCSTDQTIRIWDSETGGELLALKNADGGSFTNLRFSSNGEYLAATNERGFTEVWSATNE